MVKMAMYVCVGGMGIVMFTWFKTVYWLHHITGEVGGRGGGVFSHGVQVSRFYTVVFVL